MNDTNATCDSAIYLSGWMYEAQQTLQRNRDRRVAKARARRMYRKMRQAIREQLSSPYARTIAFRNMAKRHADIMAKIELIGFPAE